MTLPPARSSSRGPSTWRATGVTTYLENDGRLEHTQQMAGHESPRTTKLCDRTKDEITLSEVERIRLALDSMAVGRGKQTRGIELRGKLQHGGGPNLRPINIGRAAGWRIAPVDHQIVLLPATRRNPAAGCQATNKSSPPGGDNENPLSSCPCWIGNELCFADLCSREDTGVVVTANAFLATLSNSQLAAMKYDYTLANAEVWSNIPITIAAGNGLKLGGLTSSQLTPALAHILAHHCATGAREDRYRGLG